MKTKGLNLYDWPDYVWEHHVTVTTLSIDTTIIVYPWQETINKCLDSLYSAIQGLHGLYVRLEHSTTTQFVFKLYCCFLPSKQYYHIKHSPLSTPVPLSLGNQ